MLNFWLSFVIKIAPKHNTNKIRRRIAPGGDWHKHVTKTNYVKTDQIKKFFNRCRFMTHKPVQSNEKWPAPNRIFYLVVFLGVTIKIYTDSNRICVSFDDLFSRVTQEMPIFMSQNLIFQLSAHTQHNEITIVIIEICITDSLTTECFSPHFFSHDYLLWENQKKRTFGNNNRKRNN